MNVANYPENFRAHLRFEFQNAHRRPVMCFQDSQIW